MNKNIIRINILMRPVAVVSFIVLLVLYWRYYTSKCLKFGRVLIRYYIIHYCTWISRGLNKLSWKATQSLITLIHKRGSGNENSVTNCTCLAAWRLPGCRKGVFPTFQGHYCFSFHSGNLNEGNRGSTHHTQSK